FGAPWVNCSAEGASKDSNSKGEFQARGAQLYFFLSRYFGGFSVFLWIILRASKSSLTVSPYQLIFPGNFPFNRLLSWGNKSVCVSSFLARADRIAAFTASYFCLSIFF